MAANGAGTGHCVGDKVEQQVVLYWHLAESPMTRFDIQASWRDSPQTVLITDH